MERFEAERLVKQYRAYIGDLDDEVQRYRFLALFTDDASHEFDFPGFGDQNIYLPIEQYTDVFSSIRTPSVDVEITKFEPAKETTLLGTKSARFIRTTPCEENSIAAFASFEVVFTFAQTDSGLKIARVQAIGNSSTAGSIGSVEINRPGRSADDAELNAYAGSIYSELNGGWLTFSEFLQQTGGQAEPGLSVPTGVRFCMPEEGGALSDDWSDFLLRWQNCEEHASGNWSFVTWRDEAKLGVDFHELLGTGWATDLLPSEFESNGSTATGLKYSLWMPTKKGTWNWGLHGGFSLLELNGTTFWESRHWQTAAIDPDGMSYRRLTSTSDFLETVQVKSLLMELGGGLERRLGHRGPMIFAQLGIGVLQPTEISSTSQTSVHHAGYYPDFHGVTIDHPEVYDFGTHVGNGEQILAGNSALYTSGLFGIHYPLAVAPAFEPTLTLGVGMLKTLSPWFVAAPSNWINGTNEIISPLSTASTSSIASRYLHLGLGVPLFTPNCPD
jgi:hypothetical protein